MSDESAKYQAGNEQAEPAIEVERFERAGGHRWRIHSFYDGDSIALTEAGMRELLDWLLVHAKDFTEGDSTQPKLLKQPPRLW